MECRLTTALAVAMLVGGWIITGPVPSAHASDKSEDDLKQAILQLPQVGRSPYSVLATDSIPVMLARSAVQQELRQAISSSQPSPLISTLIHWVVANQRSGALIVALPSLLPIMLG